MKIQIFSENEWLYPDSELKKPADFINLDAARGSDVCFQVLTDQSISKIYSTIPFKGTAV
jgi:hypothetical protein